MQVFKLKVFFGPCLLMLFLTFSVKGFITTGFTTAGFIVSEGSIFNNAISVLESVPINSAV